MPTLKNLKEKLENNPRLAPSTIRIYLNHVDSLIKRYGENPTIEQLNQFIAEKCRNRQPAAKYGIKEYLNLIERPNDYAQLVQAKIKKPIRPKVFLSKSELKGVIDSIKKEPYRTIARLQMAFAARASGIIRIEKRRIRKEESRIRFILREKGDKPKIVYLRADMWPIIEPFYSQPKKYLFLEKEADSYTDERLDRRISTVYKRYLEHLKEAAKEHNIELSTHDIRRSVANLINITTKDPRISQKVLGHESMDTTTRYLQDNSEEVTAILLEHQEGI